MSSLLLNPSEIRHLSKFKKSVMWNNFYKIIFDDLSPYMHWIIFDMMFISFELCKFQTFLTFNLEMTVNLGQSCRVQKVFFHLLFTHLPLMFTSYTSMVPLSKLDVNLGDFPSGPVVGNHLAVQGMWVWSLVQELVSPVLRSD